LSFPKLRMIEAFPVPTITPMRLLRTAVPFDHPDFLHEVKFDGFRALAQVEGGRCTLISRSGNTFNRWPELAKDIAQSVFVLSSQG